MKLEISVQQVKELQKNGEPFIFLDVRRPEEKEIADIGGEQIPVQVLDQELHKVPKGKKIIVYCHHGVRSLRATHFLLSHGFEAISMRGGIDAWSLEIDPNIPRY